MLRELSHVEQIEDDYFRRCFQDENCFLVVWYQEDKTIHGFQFTFGSEDAERVLTWTNTHGLSRARVDYGGQRRTLHPAPILVPCDDFNEAEALAALNTSSDALPAQERDFVLVKLANIDQA